MSLQKKTTTIGALLCIIACIGEFAAVFILGHYYHGYSQLTDTMSSLGASASPVSTLISGWWVVAGICFMLFGSSFYLLYKDDMMGRVSALLIILYGLGEGVGSGLFKADHGTAIHTGTYLIHNIVGGIGVAAILLLPLAVIRMKRFGRKEWFKKLSKISFTLSVLMIALFLARYSTNPDNFFARYKGVWQRLFMLSIYVHLTLLAIFTLYRAKRIHQES